MRHPSGGATGRSVGGGIRLCGTGSEQEARLGELVLGLGGHLGWGGGGGLLGQGVVKQVRNGGKFPVSHFKYKKEHI